MADGSLYDTDFVAWTEQQTRLLRDSHSHRTNASLDWENLAEEIESLGRYQLQTLQSQIRRIIEHLLKLQFSPTEAPRRGWRDTIDNARAEIEALLSDSPSLRGKIEATISGEAVRATRLATNSLSNHDETNAAMQAKLHGGAYTQEQILGDWYPATPGATTG